MSLQAVREFLDSEDFAEPVTYTPGGGPAKVINVIFDEPFSRTSVQGIEYQNDKPQCHCATEDVADADQSATVLRNGTTYKVSEVQPDGTGITVLILSVD